MKEKIAKLMKTLDLTEEEAIALIQDDLEVDRMTSTKQINSDLTEEQKKASKQARGCGRKVAEKPVKREKKVDEIKKKILSGHEVKYANDNYNVVLVNNKRLMVYCNLNGFERNLEECEIPACYSM